MDNATSRWCVAYALAAAGRLKDAQTALEPIGPESGPDTAARVDRFLKLVLRGEKAKAAELMSPDFAAPIRTDFLFSLHVADFYAMLDERELALDWLENAVNRGFINYPYLNEYDPFLARLRSDLRFQELMVRVKTEWQRFEP